MTKDLSKDSQEIIKDQLNLNFESYSNNSILNQFTPNKRPITSSQDDLSLHNSLRRATGSNYTGSRRVTPRRVRKNDGERHLDSNIVTSPVKTLRRPYNDEYSEEYDSTTNFDDKPSIKNGSSIVNVPLRDSPKEPLRKGTPGKSANKSPKRQILKSNDKRVKTSNTSALEEAIESLKQRSFTGDNRMETDHNDNDNIGENQNSNEYDNTVLSDIPSDILSPEKHIYPKDNLTSSKKERLSSSINSTFTILQKKELYPDLAGLNPNIDLLKHAENVTSPRHSKSQNHSLRSTPNATHSPRFTPRQNSTTSQSSFKNLKNAVPDLSSPPRRITVGATTKSSSVEERRSSNLPMSQFDSSDEELPVPELTVKLDQVSPRTLNVKKRKEEFPAPVPQRKKPKPNASDQLYPSLVPLSVKETPLEEKIKDAEKIEGIEILESGHTSLYPTIINTERKIINGNLGTMGGLPQSKNKVSKPISIFEDSPIKRVNSIDQSTPQTASRGNISDASHQTSNHMKESQNSSVLESISTVREVSNSNNTTRPEIIWDKIHWSVLLKVLKKTSKHFNLEKLEIKDIPITDLKSKVLTPKIFEFFQIKTENDLTELVIRLQFMKDYEKEIYSGNI